MLPLVLLCLFIKCIITQQISCDDCISQIASCARKREQENESETKERCQGSTSGDARTELECHWRKYYTDANSGVPSESTCTDTGLCNYNQTTPYKVVDIRNTTNNYGTTCVDVRIILLHHTAVPTTEGTIDALNRQGLSVQYIVAKNGTIYYMVSDYHRAWHAGAGGWRDVPYVSGSGVNSHSVGIEIVNSGDEPFPESQMEAVEKLVSVLRKRWGIPAYYLIGHYEIAPDRKNDPSGYFKWKELSDSLGIYPALFATKQSPSEQEKVLLEPENNNATKLAKVQESLYQFGYSYLNMTSGEYDTNTKLTFQAFNRHFSPEVFKLETVDKDDNTVYNPDNQKWYGMSQERLDYLSSNVPDWNK